jgi:hypothetical protein
MVITHQSQFIHEVKALAEAHTDSETTIEELRRSPANLSQRLNESEAQHGKVLSEKYDPSDTYACIFREKDASINALSLRAQGEGFQALRLPLHPHPPSSRILRERPGRTTDLPRTYGIAAQNDKRLVVF